MFSFFSPSYVDNYWIKDRTFFSDMKLGLTNAALGAELNMLHSWSYNNPFGLTQQYDLGSLLAGFWNTAYKNANASFSMNMMNMPMLQDFQFPEVPVVQSPWKTPSPDRKPDKELTDEEKREFQQKKDAFNKLYKEYDELDAATKEALGLNKILKSVRESYNADSNNTPETMQNCIDELNEKINGITSSKLKDILGKVKNEELRDNRADALYKKDTDDDTIKGITEGASAITKGNILSELDTVMGGKGEKSVIEVLTSREDAKEEPIKAAVASITNALIERAAEEDVKGADNVKEARNALITARDAYKEKVNDGTKKNLVTAFENLYKVIKLTKAQKQDEENLKQIEELPDALKERYLTEDGKLKDEFRINEKETINFLNGIRKGWVSETEITKCGFTNMKLFSNTAAGIAPDKDTDTDKNGDGADDENKKPGFWARVAGMFDYPGYVRLR